MSENLFCPVGATVNVSASGTTGNVALSVLPGKSRTIRVYNGVAAVAFINFGSSSAVEAAAASSMPIGPGATDYFTVGPKVTHVAAITGGTSGTVYFTAGEGA